MIAWTLQEIDIDWIIDCCERRAKECNVPMSCIMSEVEAAALNRLPLAKVWLEYPPEPRIVLYLEPSRLERMWSRVVAVVQWVRRLGD